MDGSFMVKIKRVYEEADEDDGVRVLVDRLWPRGLKKEGAHVDLWLRDIAPSTRLRKLFSHDPSRWGEFCRRYREELLGDSDRKRRLEELVRLASGETLTLLYSARDRNHNNAVALGELIKELLKEHPPQPPR
jgi:uncharacterized protein YeaO (DUF488 family)